MIKQTEGCLLIKSDRPSTGFIVSVFGLPFLSGKEHSIETFEVVKMDDVSEDDFLQLCEKIKVIKSL